MPQLAGRSNRASAAILAGTTSSVVINQTAEDTATFDVPNLRINGNATNTAAAAGTAGIALGGTTVASGNRSLALGYGANATAASAVAEGYGAVASAARAIAVGFGNTASAADASIVGGNTLTNALATSVMLAAGSSKLLHLCAPSNIPQLTSNNTAVELNSPVGTITMFDDVNGGAAQFTFTNSYIKATSLIMLDVEGEAGQPVNAWVATRAAGSCVIDVVKVGTPTVPAVIHFVVFNTA